MSRFITAAMLVVALGPGSAVAQVSTIGGAPGPSPLGITSPLGLGAAAPVSPTGIPLGAAELVPQGTSPGATAAGLATTDIAVCAGFGGSIPEASFGAPTSEHVIRHGLDVVLHRLRWRHHRNCVRDVRSGRWHDFSEATDRRRRPPGMSRWRTRRSGGNSDGINRAGSRRPQPRLLSM